MKNLKKKNSSGLLLAEYEKLIMLKKALFINDNKEVSESMLIKLARDHNLKEIYIIAYLVNAVIKAPQEIKEQNELLINSYTTPKEYAKRFKQTLKLYKSHPKFRKYAATVISDLDLCDFYNNAVVNLTIYGLCHELISTTVRLEPYNVILNFHILQKWLSMQNRFLFSCNV